MPRRLLLPSVLAVIAIHASLLWIYWVPEPKGLLGDEKFYLEAAGNILAGDPSGLDLLWPPLYPHFVAWTLALAGGSLVGLQIAQTLLLVWVAIVLRGLWRHFHANEAVGDLLALIVLIYPPLVAFAHYAWPGILHLALGLTATWILIARRDRLPWLGLAGVLLGLALLTKSLLEFFVPILLLPLALTGERRRGLLGCAVVLAGIAITVAPTIRHNWRTHQVAVIADSSTFNLWVGLNEVSRRNFDDEIVGAEYESYRISAPTFRERTRLLRARIGSLLRERGWARTFQHQLSHQYFRLFDRASFLTNQLPGGLLFQPGAGYRTPPRFIVGPLRLTSYIMWALILVAAVAGIALCPGERNAWGRVALGFLAYCLVLFFFLHVKTRHRLQFLPILLLYAGSALDWWQARRSAGGVPLPSSGVVIAAATAAALVLFLAFGAPVLDAFEGP